VVSPHAGPVSLTLAPSTLAAFTTTGPPGPIPPSPTSSATTLTLILTIAPLPSDHSGTGDLSRFDMKPAGQNAKQIR
jgi:hypothetical protein